MQFWNHSEEDVRHWTSIATGMSIFLRQGEVTFLTRIESLAGIHHSSQIANTEMEGCYC